MVIFPFIYALLFLTSKVAFTGAYSFDTNGNLNFNPNLVFIFMITSWLLSLIPFYWKNNKKISLGKDWANYFCFTTSLMWLAPLTTELIIVLTDVNGMNAQNSGGSALGTGGFTDFLFLSGFTSLISGLAVFIALKIIGKKLKAVRVL